MAIEIENALSWAQLVPAVASELTKDFSNAPACLRRGHVRLNVLVQSGVTITGPFADRPDLLPLRLTHTAITTALGRVFVDLLPRASIPEPVNGLAWNADPRFLYWSRKADGLMATHHMTRIINHTTLAFAPLAELVGRVPGMDALRTCYDDNISGFTPIPGT